jgi:hypothetical protein
MTSLFLLLLAFGGPRPVGGEQVAVLAGGCF